MGETDVETMGNVTVAKYDFDDEAFNDISEDALNFITHLLVKETDKRMTASECLQHDWLLRRSDQPSSMAIPKVQLISDLSPPLSPPLVDNDQDSSTLSDIENSESDYLGEPLPEEEELPTFPPPLPKTQPPPMDLLMESSLPIIIPATTKPASPVAVTDEVVMIGEPQVMTAENATELVIKTQSLSPTFLLIKSPAAFPMNGFLLMSSGLCLLIIIISHCANSMQFIPSIITLGHSRDMVLLYYGHKQPQRRW